MAPKQLNFITGNKNKLAEVQAILAPTGVDLSNQSVDLLEIQGTIEEISKDKCRRAADTVCNRVTKRDFTEDLLSWIFHLGWWSCPGRRHMLVL
jgi:inosine triphosphate pyrophosphatase